MPQVGVTHHLKLGDEYLIVRPNTYQKSPAPTFGARITTGDPDYNNLSIWQHWVQKCWVGGMDADEWVDDAMYKEAVGLDTTRHEKVTLSRHLKRGSGLRWDLGGSTEVFRGKFCVFKGLLYCLVGRDSPTDTADSRLYVYDTASETWTGVFMPGNAFVARVITTFDGKLFVAGTDTTAATDYARIYWATTPGTWTTILNPVGVSGSPGVTAMKVYNTKMYVAFGTVIWRMLDTFEVHTLVKTWDGGTAFYKVNSNSGSNYIVTMETHLGFLYMLSQNGHLHRTDGNNSFDIWSWDGQSSGISLRSYDGKLFVGTYEYSDAPTFGYGVLYQFTGAAVTELKRWGDVGKNTALGNMIVYDRRLFYGASSLLGIRPGFGIACYDAAEDGHSIYAIQDNVTSYPDTSGTGRSWLVDDIIVYGGKMFCFVRGYGAFFTEDTFRDIERGRAQFTTSTLGGTLVSSLYDGGTPGLLKIWRRIVVWATLPTAATSMVVSFSMDHGTTWTTFTTQTGGFGKTSYSFAMNNQRGPDFMWRITFKTTDETKSPSLRGVSVAYLPQPEPNWMWSFVVPVADIWELMDGTEEAKDTNDLVQYLENLFRNQYLIQFVDIDHKMYTATGPGVLVYDINVLHYDIEVPREADVRITLLEVVEDYTYV